MVGQWWEGLGHPASNPTEQGGEAEGPVKWQRGHNKVGKVLRSSGGAAGGTGGLRVLTQDLLLAAGPFLCLHHPVCGASLGCRHGPHGGLLHQQNIMDPLWPPDALVRAACSTLHPCLMCHSASSPFSVSLGMRFAGQDMLTSCLAQVRCRVPQKAQGAANRHQAYACGTDRSPAVPGCPPCHCSCSSSSLPEGCSGAKLRCWTLFPWRLLSPGQWQGRAASRAGVIAPTGRRDGGVRGGGMPADSHEDALLTGKRLSWLWVSARGCFRRPWEQGAERRSARGELQQMGQGLCSPKGLVPAPRAGIGDP